MEGPVDFEVFVPILAMTKGSPDVAKNFGQVGLPNQWRCSQVTMPFRRKLKVSTITLFRGWNAHYLELNLHAKCQNNQRESLKWVAHNVLRQSWSNSICIWIFQVIRRLVSTSLCFKEIHINLTGYCLDPGIKIRVDKLLFGSRDQDRVNKLLFGSRDKVILYFANADYLNRPLRGLQLYILSVTREDTKHIRDMCTQFILIKRKLSLVSVA